MMTYEGITINLNAKTVVCDGKELDFTKLEFELLSFFLASPSEAPHPLHISVPLYGGTPI